LYNLLKKFTKISIFLAFQTRKLRSCGSVRSGESHSPCKRWRYALAMLLRKLSARLASFSELRQVAPHKPLINTKVVKNLEKSDGSE